MAVIPVVLYHLDPALVPGGFIGVDVFFVISGFLITSIILREREAGTFTLRNFWMRRIRRLFPALAVLLLATLLAGNLLLYPDEWRDLGAQLLAVLLLVANVHLYQETGGYWGPAVEEVPLLHTWSLAVEEQFYLLFPLLILVLLRCGKRCLFPVLALGALASLAHGLTIIDSDPAYSFYLLPPRAWELLAGCLLAVWNWRRRRPFQAGALANLFAGLGLGAVLASYFLIGRGDDFPGTKALLPVLGTVFIIAFTAGERSPAKSILSTPILVFIGKISYSLYLWHWPLIVFWRLYTMEQVSAPHHAIPIFILSLAAATLSYFFVERPFRRHPFPVLSRQFAVLTIAFLSLLALSFAIRGHRFHPLASPAFEPGRFSSHVYDARRDEAWKSGGVIVGEEPPDLVVIGSSHALMYASTVADLARQHDRTVAFLCLGNAFGRFYTEGDHAIFRDGIAAQRHEFDRARLDFLSRWKPKQVLWFGRWDNQYEILGSQQFFQRIRASLGILLAHSERVTVFTQPPFSMERRASLPRYATTLKRKNRPVIGRESPDRIAHREAANHAIRALAREHPQIDLVELADPFELTDGRTRLLSDDGRFLYHDYDHLSDHGAALVRDRINSALLK